jgi:hypothetical protein
MRGTSSLALIIVLVAHPQLRDDDTSIGSHGLQPHDDNLIRVVQPLSTTGGAALPAPAKVSPGTKQKKNGTVTKKLANLLSGGQVAKAEAKVANLEQVGPCLPPSLRLTHFWARVGGGHAHVPQPA